MLKKLPTAYLTALVVGLGSQFALAPAQAEGFGPMNMMNPGQWFGGKDRDNLDGDYPPLPPPGYGAPYGAPGYGAPPPGYGYGAPPAGAPAYGAPGAYGVPAAPGYSAPAAPGYGAQSASEPSRQEMESRIQELEQRLREMEARNQVAVPAPQPTTPPSGSHPYYSGDQTPSSYPFRPMDLGR